MAAGLLDRIGATFGLPPVYVPISVPASEFGVLPARDSMAGRDILAPTDGAGWPNRVTARSLLGGDAFTSSAASADASNGLVGEPVDESREDGGQPRCRRHDP